MPEAWSSEPAAHEEPTEDSLRPSDEQDDEAPPPTALGTRLRSIVSPVLVTLVAAALAFAGMRVVLGGGLDGLGIASSALLGGGAPRDGGTRDSVATAPTPPALEAPPPVTQPIPAAAVGALPAADAGSTAAPAAASDAGAPRAEPTASAPDTAGVSFTAEQLDPPAGPALPAGHGVLELQTWEPQRLYVDGVFVGNYATRLIPLTPGTYRVRFGTPTRELEHPATIVAGRRTRLTARPEKAP